MLTTTHTEERSNFRLGSLKDQFNSKEIIQILHSYIDDISYLSKIHITKLSDHS